MGKKRFQAIEVTSRLKFHGNQSVYLVYSLGNGKQFLTLT